jgi:hypothetical protein
MKNGGVFNWERDREEREGKVFVSRLASDFIHQECPGGGNLAVRWQGLPPELLQTQCPKAKVNVLA